MPAYKQAVALVPGFLGFNHRRGTTYFADRFVAGLRTRLERTCGGPIPVVPVSTLPIGSLAERQKQLLVDLTTLDKRLGSPRWHLLGHSTGGVDAAMLARKHKLKHSDAGSYSSDELLTDVPRLASVTTVSAPHYGTCLALSSLAQLVRGMRTAAGIGEAFEAARAVLERDQRWQRIEFILPALLHNSEFYQNFFNNPLATDLTPAVCAALTNRDNRRADVPVTSFASLAPKPDANVHDELFALLWNLTQERANDPDLVKPKPFPTVPPNKVISASATLPPIDASANDGVVNTDRQVDIGGSFGALIVGDHGDVVGRYHRVDLLDDKTIDPGLLTSGAGFGDDEFFAVLDHIARAIAPE